MWRTLARDDDRDNVPAKGSRRQTSGFADLNGMTNFRSEETRRHDGKIMADVVGSKWFPQRN